MTSGNLFSLRGTSLALWLCLFALLFVFSKPDSLFFGVLSFLLVGTYHHLVERRFSFEQIRAAGLLGAHVTVSLFLCTLLVWATTGDVESPYWIIYAIPIIIAALNYNLLKTLLTCSVASALYFSQVPLVEILDPAERHKEIPELAGFSIMLFLVGILVQAFSEQHRRQISAQKELNDQLLANQKELRESLDRLQAAEEQLRRKDRLAALGEMAAGLAHEIRNPLGIISSSTQLLSSRLKGIEPKQQKLLKVVDEETTRLNGLVSDFLQFSRPSAPCLERCDIRPMAQHVCETVQGLADQKAVSLELQLPSDPVPVLVDLQLFQQALLNLLLNAIDAVERAGNIDVQLALSPASVSLAVRDNGSGIPRDSLSKIFNPFFTTKDKGVGLGLANTHRIVESHGGEISVESTLGQGTAVTVVLPLAEA